jgi:hypothetical protein
MIELLFGVSVMNDPYNVDARLSRLETIIDNISEALERLTNKLEAKDKINWAPVAIGVTIFFTVAGSISTIYNARISTLNTAVEQIGDRTLTLEKGGVERSLKIQVQEEKIRQLEKEVEDIQREQKDR